MARSILSAKYISLFSLFSLLGACASQTTTPSDAADTQIPAAVSSSEPSAPPVAEAVSSKALIAAPAPAPRKKEGVMAIIEKMEDNPFTLYWRDNNSYSYYIGSQYRAEYQPGQGLTLKEDKEENALVCKYDAKGKLDLTNADPQGAEAIKKACSELMFTFDQQLED